MALYFLMLFSGEGYGQANFVLSVDARMEQLDSNKKFWFLSIIEVGVECSLKARIMF